MPNFLESPYFLTGTIIGISIAALVEPIGIPAGAIEIGETPAHSLGKYDSNPGIPTMLDILERRALYCSQVARISYVLAQSFTTWIWAAGSSNSKYASEAFTEHDVNFAVVTIKMET